MKKIILAVLVLAVCVAAGLNYFSRKAPEMLRAAIERALDKAVKIETIEFNFPWNFELSRVEIRDNQGPFKGELCFAVDTVHLAVSPLSLSQKDLIVDRLDIDNASIVIRSRGGRLYHVLSDAMPARPAVPGEAGEGAATEATGRTLPLAIRHLRLSNGNFQFVDYDAQPGGFVISMNRIEASMKDLSLPSGDQKTFYRVDAQLPQGRGQQPAQLKISGWTVFSSYDTDALLTATSLHLPYFEPYLKQVTPAQIQDGYLNCRSSVRADRKYLTANADIQLSGIYFQSYENGEELFGLKAEEILSFLKDVSGKLRFQIVLEWSLDDPKLKKSEVIRRSIERSLKKTVLGNVGNLLESTLKKFGEGGLDSSKDDWQGALKKVKELFR